MNPYLHLPHPSHWQQLCAAMTQQAADKRAREIAESEFIRELLRGDEAGTMKFIERLSDLAMRFNSWQAKRRCEA